VQHARDDEEFMTSSSMRAVAVTAVLFLMYAAFGLCWIGVVPLFPELDAALGIDKAQGSQLVSVISYSKSVFPILAGILAARIGLTSTLRLAGALIALSIVVPWLPGYGAWLGARFLFGVGGSAWGALLGEAALRAVDARARPLVNAVLAVAINVGVIGANLCTLPLAGALGFRATLSLYGSITGLCLVGLWTLGSLHADANDTVTTSKPSVRALLLQYRDVLRVRATWVGALAYTGPLAVYLVLNTWLAEHLQQAFGIERQVTHDLLGLQNICGVVASVATGVLLQRGLVRTKPALLVGAIALPVSVFVVVTLDGPRALWVGLVGASLAITAGPLVTLLQRQRAFAPGRFGMVTGTVFSVSYLVSSAVLAAVAAGVAAQVPLGAMLVVVGVLGASPALALVLHDPG
jgi:predicted MFS family arabinose efflux permease